MLLMLLRVGLVFLQVASVGDALGSGGASLLNIFGGHFDIKKRINGVVVTLVVAID